MVCLLLIISILLPLSAIINAKENKFPRLKGPEASLMCKIFIRITLILSLLVLNSFVLADENLERKIAQVDKLFAEYTMKTPGAAVAIVYNGKVVHLAGYGNANLDYEIPITPSTVFSIGSCSKQFTAMAIAILAKEGKISLDDDIRKYIPEMNDFGHTITIRHLLHHTSGLRDYAGLMRLAGYHDDDFWDRDRVLKIITRQKNLNFIPGEEYLYSNTNYALLGEIVVRVAEQPLSVFTKKKIFDVLKMSNTNFFEDYQMIIKNRSESYIGRSDHYLKGIITWNMPGAGYLFTTADDMAKWLLNFDNQTLGKDLMDIFLSRGSFNNGKMMVCGFGIAHREYRGKKVYRHDGGHAGYSSIISYFPDDRFGVAVLYNVNVFNPGATANKIADIFLELKSIQYTPLYRFPERIFLAPDVLNRFVGFYTMEIGNFQILLDKGKLYYFSPGENREELIPFTETSFYMEGLFRQEFTFELDEDGKANHFTFQGRTKKFKGERIKGFPEPTFRIKDYVGTYYSEEIDTYYRLVDINNVLTVQNIRVKDFTLGHSKDDSFYGPRDFRQVTFTRNDKGEVDGFLVSSNRVRNLKFIKK
jgi:CubicO group peptidase (beta-lactamase class C family)